MSSPAIVLLHGLFGFSRIIYWDYFNGVRKFYEQRGLRVLVPRVPGASTIDVQARSLARQLAGERGPLHLIAHSMGGLYARYYITHCDGHKKVRSLTTLSTPHRGSPAADYICNNISFYRLFDGVHELTTGHMKTFNENTPDSATVRYYSYSSSRPVNELPWSVRDLARIIQQAEGANDAQVSVTSAIWGEHVRTLHADHFEVIGQNFWLNPFRQRRRFDHLDLYREIADRITQQSG
ncbi:MAG: alpha/beta fold hydrolase [Mariprofundaceae bacterium]|nr:alpha/beta fold hydrolase [Mariprofundaceae bacterium]